MTKVAIAGGTGGLGRAIVEAFSTQTTHTVIVLTRKENPELEAKIKAKFVEVDYSDVASIQKILDKHEIHTVISAMGIASQDHSDSQINLIRAAAASPHVKRFAPSEFGLIYEQKHGSLLPIAQFKLDALAELEKTDLEFTLFSNGYFMDYMGVPKYESYLVPFTTVIDIKHRFAGIPGSGETPVVFTSTRDVGKFVVASVGLGKWSRRSLMIGDRVSWNEILAIAEKATGSKFEVHYDSVEKLKTGQITELPGHKNFYPFFPKEHLQGLMAAMGLWFEQGDFNFKPSVDESLNEKFPEIKPATMAQVVNEGWA